ncbi:phospholipase D precursor, putative [Coccidioides posadasii C735 delta SOWgp]|uniref:Phospholipase D, putative n=1 Tax=Coccidioides posadasii (strain C735) TaxID=222929 RepID=C5PE08_COCP7|nr:phospholipase D precursor, putative [Coccidioides posadasii C735 delta SOWgp]EER25319.1 phospholipase D precursor, putative [Coccidioides posadasii C735 delta SOWgp]|eukprot:XP_003067464.1 phospholipase D precursor, putative [Coccidioides posadasii C735 delta SOWgp]
MLVSTLVRLLLCSAALFSSHLAVAVPVTPDEVEVDSYALETPTVAEPVTPGESGVGIDAIEPRQAANQRPIYAIAHRVLTAQGVRDALKHGANAIEIDLCAWRKWNTWLADHDCATGSSAGDSAVTMFETIVEEHKKGKDVTFVWLDMKNPDYCEPRLNCSIEALRNLARKTLEPEGIRVLFGFYKAEKSRALKVIREKLNPYEAVSLSGKASAVLKEYEGKVASGIPVAQRVMDYGYYNLRFEFGGCHEGGYYTCTELRQGAQLRDEGKLGKVYGWTSSSGQVDLVNQLLGTAGVDGIIYGFEMTYYYDDVLTWRAALDILTWVKEHGNTHRMATRADPPW